MFFVCSSRLVYRVVASRRVLCTTAYPAMADFLIHVGRRKFLSPLYKALSQTESGKEFALEVYKEARPNYHFVSANSIDAILRVSNTDISQKL